MSTTITDWRMNPQLFFEEYEKRGQIVLEEEKDNTTMFLVEQIIFKKINSTGTCTDLEKQFLIDYMKLGVMNEDEILDWDDLRVKYPNIMLPEVNF